MIHRNEALEKICDIVIRLHKEGNRCPNLDEITMELDRRYPNSKYFKNGDSITTKEYIKLHLSYVRSYLYNRDAVLTIPVRAMFCIDGYPRTRSIVHAKCYLSGNGHPVYAIYFHASENDYLYQAFYWEKLKNREYNAREKGIEFLMLSTEQGAISTEDAIMALEENNKDLEFQINRNIQLINRLKKGPLLLQKP